MTSVFAKNGNYAFSNKIFDRKCESSLKPSSFNVPVRPCATSMEIKFLKALILKGVDVNDEGLKKVLEHLFIYDSCKLVKAKIHGKGLAPKNLEIIYCEGLESIEIFDSNIVSFNCRGSQFDGSPISLRLDNLQKLEKISVYVHKMKINDMFCQISCCIPYLQVLELSIYSLLQEDMQFFLFPKLPKLKQLINGTTLLRISTTFGLINREVRQAAKQPHYQHLEVVKIGNYHRQTSDFDVVMYFIENFVALKELVIKPKKRVHGKEIEDEHVARYNAQ